MGGKKNAGDVGDAGKLAGKATEIMTAFTGNEWMHKEAEAEEE